MRVVIGADHAGFLLKSQIVESLRQGGYVVLDEGTWDAHPVDYPDIALAVGRAVLDDRADRGILICGSGVGASIAANKLKRIRAGLCHDTYSASQGVAHDDMNVLVLGARVIGPALADVLVAAFLSATFSNAERHVRRLRKIENLMDVPIMDIHQRVPLAIGSRGELDSVRPTDAHQGDDTMTLGMIGLGRMGANMARRLMAGGHTVVVHDLSAKSIAALTAEGATGAASLDDFVRALPHPRVAWLMVPAGDPTEQMVNALAQRFEAGDTIIDGGNSKYQDDIQRAQRLSAKGIHYVDSGTSGGLWGLTRGYSLMVGGEPDVVAHLEPIFRTLAPGDDGVTKTPGGRTGTAERGYLHCGPAGAGHFVKMVHNGIEYGLMQAYAEGFDLLQNAGALPLPEGYRYNFDLPDIAEVWRHGSVVGSWLLDLTATALVENPDLSNYSGVVQDSGEGRWTIETAIAEAVPTPVLAAALFARFRSREEHTFADRVLSAMRFKFGGHVEPTGTAKS